MTLNTERIRIAAPPSQQRLAQELKTTLAEYRIPVNVKRGKGIQSLSEIPDDWLIVICTPETPGDPAVLSAIDDFLKEGERDRILTLLAEGTPKSSFPENLLREVKPDGTVIEHEPLAANITADDPGKSLKKLQVEKLRILAPMLGTSFDGLMNRSRKRRNRILLAASAAVFVAFAVFLGLAVSRMRQTAAQEAELQRQFEQKEGERQKAEEAAHQARISLGETIALEARDALERNNTELALLLCLEFEREMPESEILQKTFADALKRRCAAGYVPITSEKSYKRTRGMDKVLVDETYRDQQKPTAAAEEKPALPGSCDIPVPESAPGDKTWINNDGLAWMGLRCYSVQQDCAVYRGSLKYDEPNERKYALWIRSIENPEEAYWLRNQDGTLFTKDNFIGAEFITDSILLIFSDRKPFCYDTAGREWLSLPGTDTELPFSVEKITDIGLPDKVFVFGEKAFAVYEREPFRLLYVIDDKVTENAITKDNSGDVWVGATAGALPDGEERIVIGNGHVYDAKTGDYLFKFGGEKARIFGSSEYGTHEFSAEGWLPVFIGKDCRLIDMRDGSDAAAIENTGGSRYILYGPADERTGLRSASLLLTYLTQVRETENSPRIFWEYHETATDVPEVLDEQIALAKKLLNGRKLVPSERNRYHLE